MNARWIWWAALVASVWPRLAFAAEPPTEGGTVRGVVTLTGAARSPDRAVFPDALAAPDRKLCESKRPLITPFYVTGDEGGLANVAVWIEGVKAGREMTREKGMMVNEDCRFLPHVQTLDIGAKVQIENQDPILHNTHAIYRDQPITAFNIGMPRKGQVALKRVRRPGILRIQCDAGHTWMRAWIHVFKHPYHTVTDREGRYEIPGVPAGSYALHFWHENSGQQTRTIEVKSGRVLTEAVEFEPRPLPPKHARGLDL
jgi:hypothetical protein